MSIGVKVLDYAENIAKGRGYKKVNLMGRVSAEVFYNKIGYKTLSQPYDYHTISHIDMEKEL